MFSWLYVQDGPTGLSLKTQHTCIIPCLRLRSHLAISVENFTKCRRSLCKVYRILQCFGPSSHNNKSFHWLISACYQWDDLLLLRKRPKYCKIWQTLYRISTEVTKWDRCLRTCDTLWNFLLKSPGETAALTIIIECRRSQRGDCWPRMLCSLYTLLKSRVLTWPTQVGN